MVVQEFCRRVSLHQCSDGLHAFGFICPDRGRFLPGSEPVRTREPLKRWPGGRVQCIWLADSRPEMCGPAELEPVSGPSPLPAKSQIPRPAAGRLVDLDAISKPVEVLVAA